MSGLRENLSFTQEVESLESYMDAETGILFMIDNSEDGQKSRDSFETLHNERALTATTPENDICSSSSAPAELVVGSPYKKVQFEIGDSIEDCTLKLPGSNSDSPIGGRGESRDYILQSSATIALLPAIEEERHNLINSQHHFPVSRSISLNVDSKMQGDRNPEMPLAFGFVQLDLLTGEGELGKREWVETGRWIKYEEDLEENQTFGKPHLATLSFHSLIKLKSLIEKDGIVMLNLKETDMPGVAYRIVEELATKGLIKTEESPLLMRTLLLKHRHVVEPEKSWFGLKRITTSSAVSLQSLFDDKSKSKTVISTTNIDPSILGRRNSLALQKCDTENSLTTTAMRTLQRTASGNYLRHFNDFIHVEMKDINNRSSPEEESKFIQPKQENKSFLRAGAIGTMVMVADIENVRKPIFVFVRLCEPSYMINVTEVPIPVGFICLLLVPPNYPIYHIEIGRSVGTLMSNRSFFKLASLANGRKSLVEGINEFLDESIVLPPGDWDNHDLLPIHVLQAKSKLIRQRRKKMKAAISSNEANSELLNGHTPNMPNGKQGLENADDKDPFNNPFIRTGKPFGGLINDIKRRLPHYKSDFTDAFNMQCVSTIFFMFFASIAHVITFAGLMGEKTENLIGISETLMSTAISGVIFGLLSGQPMVPIGPTGPLLVFDEILFAFCKRHDIEFLPARLWISVWLCIICAIVVLLEGSIFVKWFTRFTQDIFAVLTSLLLIFESIDNLVEIYQHHPLSALQNFITRPINNSDIFSSNGEEATLIPYIDETEELRRQPNTALLCTILLFGTFFLANYLREFKNSIFLGENIRRIVGDFSVTISVILMVFLDYCITDTYTQKMKVPTGLEPSSDERGWIISPLGTRPISYLVIFGSILPALLLFILIFMTTEICELIVNSKERKLKKGSGFHLDLLLIAIINLFGGFFGAPWLCCATVRGLSHVNALSVYSTNNPPGEKPAIMFVREQRVTSIAVAILIGCSVLMAPILKFIPLAVLFGVFLYLGVTSFSSTQLYDRIRLFFIPVKDHPSVNYVRKIRTWRMHLYTSIQITALAVLWGIKSTKEAALVFPFILLCLVPIRLQLKHIFNKNELEALDGDGKK